MKSSKKKLLENTIMLYLIQFSNYLFSFIIVPLQTRILGPVYYGKIGFATALMMYFQLFIDFGFILSATEEVAKNRNNKKELKHIYTSVTILKIIFSLVSMILLLGLCLLNTKIKNDYNLYFIYLIGVVINSFLPDYLYRGLEQMSDITYRTIFIKMISTVMIFIFLKKPEDYLIVPILLAFGNLIAVIWANYQLSKKFKISLCKVSFEDVTRTFLNSSTFFLSRIASTLYTATNTIILGFIDKTGNVVGYFTASDKLIGSGKGILSPIADSVYPYMVKNKDFRLIKRILMIFMPIISIGTIIIFAFAEDICVLIFGAEFAFAAPILRAMLPMAIITLPNYLLGFPTLGAMGLSEHANKSIYFGTTIHIANLVGLYITGHLNMITLALLASMADGLILLYRAIIIYKYRDILEVK